MTQDYFQIYVKTIFILKEAVARLMAVAVRARLLMSVTAFQGSPARIAKKLRRISSRTLSGSRVAAFWPPRPSAV
jgi:hypothetical protein